MSESGEESQSRRSKCRNAECGKTFSTRSNRDRHEKKVGHTPAQRRNSIQVPIFNKDLNEYCCPNCLVTSKFKSNITRHIKKGCKTKKKDNKVCPHCKQTFAQKSNRDRHIKRFHPTDESNYSHTNTNDHEVQIPTFDNETSETLNVSILSDDSTVIEQSMRIIDTETPIFEVFQPDENQGPLESTLAQSESFHHQNGPLSTSRDSAHQNDDSPSISMDIPALENHVENTSDIDNDSDNEFSFLKDLEIRAKQREMDHESLFKTKVLNKLKMDIKSRSSKCSTAKFLYESFGDSLNDYHFVFLACKEAGIEAMQVERNCKKCPP